MAHFVQSRQEEGSGLPLLYCRDYFRHRVRALGTIPHLHPVPDILEAP